MKQRLLVSSIVMGLCATMAVGSAFGQDQGGDNKKQATELTGITVTGSLIPQAQIETASPVLTITADQIKRQGFGNVYDALRAQPLATGAVQDGQFQGGFTQGASALSLLGLDPSFTLTLIDGHPLADYPLLYNGSSNFADLSNIPVGMVDHIDILPGNQSSIYGSSAIAGVINIILKQKIDGTELDYRVGGYDHGGGANQRLEIIGGQSFGSSIDLTYGLQLSNTSPVWGFQRDLTSSTNFNPNSALRYGARTFLYETIGPTKNIDPGAATCAGISSLFGGTTDYEFRPGRGYYCGSKAEPGYGTIQNGSREASAYLHLTDRINDNMELYGTLLYDANSERYSDGRRFWTPNGTNGAFVNANTGGLELFQHIFAPEESGGLGATEIHELQRAYNFYGGVRGSVGGSNWNYDAYVDRSSYEDDSQEKWPLQAKIDQFFEGQFLGPKMGTTSGYPIYSPNAAGFYKPLTPAQYNSFQGLITSLSKTYTQHLNLQVTNTDLFSLPAGSVGVAGLLQVGDQSWSNPAQAELLDGDFYGRTGTSGAGKRDNYALGGEIRIPIFAMLTADASARYDDYSNQGSGGGGDSKATYKVGLEFRPVESLLFRGNYATAFRAPDMAYTFGGKSGFFSTAVDYYRCAKVEPQNSVDNCTYNNVQYFDLHQGNHDLQSITAKSFGGGLVWSPTSNFDMKADYYNIKISNEVSLQSVDLLLRQEAACRLGQADIASPTCVAAIAQVQRNSATAAQPYVLNEVDVFPINIANERVSGIVASTNYRIDAGRYGDFNFGGNYNVTLSHKYQQYPTDPVIDDLRNPFYSTEFKSIFSGSVGWKIDNWSATVLGTRYGKTPNYAAQLATAGYAAPNAGTMAPHMVYNSSVGYNFSDDATLTLIVNNVLDSGPPIDKTYTAAPYYNFVVYNVYGRQYWLEFDLHFGRGK